MKPPYVQQLCCGFLCCCLFFLDQACDLLTYSSPTLLCRHVDSSGDPQKTCLPSDMFSGLNSLRRANDCVSMMRRTWLRTLDPHVGQSGLLEFQKGPPEAEVRVVSAQCAWTSLSFIAEHQSIHPAISFICVFRVENHRKPHHICSGDERVFP